MKENRPKSDCAELLGIVAALISNEKVYPLTNVDGVVMMAMRILEATKQKAATKK